MEAFSDLFLKCDSGCGIQGDIKVGYAKIVKITIFNVKKNGRSIVRVIFLIRCFK